MKSLSLLALAATAAALPAEPQGLTASVPVKYNPNSKADIHSAIAKLQAKYGVVAAKNDDGDESGTVPTSPSDAADDAYITEVQVGTPAQTFKMDFDTGSSDLWLYSNDTVADLAKGHTLYQPGDSTTAHKIAGETWGIHYADDSTSGGIVYRDIVTIGGLTAKKQGVESAINVSTSNFPGSGLLGLALDKGNTAKPTKQKTWFSNIKDSLKEPLFTVRLRHQADGTYNFGYIDKSQYSGDILYTDAFTDNLGHRLFSVDGYAIGDGNMTEATFSATPDTGSTLFLVPDYIAEDYFSGVNGSYSTYSGNTKVWVYSCDLTDSLPDFVVGINGQNVTVPGNLFQYKEVGDGDCASGLAGADRISPDIAIFGDVFLKAIFTIFDDGNNRIGFAKGE